MSVLHVLPVPGTERAKIKFTQFRNTTKAPFVIYADFESILEPLKTNAADNICSTSQSVRRRSHTLFQLAKFQSSHNNEIWAAGTVRLFR